MAPFSQRQWFDSPHGNSEIAKGIYFMALYKGGVTKEFYFWQESQKDTCFYIDA